MHAWSAPSLAQEGKLSMANGRRSARRAVLEESPGREVSPRPPGDGLAGADAGVVSLPPTFGEAVRAEFGRALRPPWATVSTVAANGAFMTLAWIFLPRGLKDDLFTLHGTLAFALVLAAWMYSDVPATNVLAPDRLRVMAALDDPVMLRRLLYAQNVVLWAFITPVCALIALFTGIFGHDLLSTLYTVIWIGVVPFGALGISAWVGILFPYHPLPLRYRWQHRRPRRRMLWRWLTLAVTPYVLVPWLAIALMTPSLLLWGFTSPHGLSRKLPDHDLGLGVALACAVAIVCAFIGHRRGVKMAQRRQARLLAFLADPARG